MTAISPARLKIQTAELGELIGQADKFTIRLHELLAFYSARVRQTSLSRIPLSLQAYQVPEPVIQALENEITAQLQEDPRPGYPLVDALWKERWVEFRRLAVFVLGILPPHQAHQILGRIQSWLEECTAEDIRQLIMTRGMNRLAAENPAQSLKYLEELINSGTKSDHQAALFGLGAYARDPDFPNLPLLYKYLGKILLVEEAGLVKEISALLRILAARSEQETTYFLINQLGTASKPRISRVIRQVLGKLTPENQLLLRDKLETTKN